MRTFRVRFAKHRLNSADSLNSVKSPLRRRRMRRRRRRIACLCGAVGRTAQEIAKALELQGSGQRHCAWPSGRRPGFGRDQPGETRDRQEGGDGNFRIASGRFGTRPVKPQSRHHEHRLGVENGPPVGQRQSRVGGSGSDQMEVEEIKSSRGKTVFFLMISMALASIFVMNPSETAADSYNSFLGVAFFGLGSVIFVFLLIHPQRLLLSPTGFQVSGGLIRSPKHVLWHEVGPFFVYYGMVGYDFVPGARQDSALIRLNRLLGAEAALPKGWPESAERMVERLNAFRDKALAQDAGSGAT